MSSDVKDNQQLNDNPTPIKQTTTESPEISTIENGVSVGTEDVDVGKSPDGSKNMPAAEPSDIPTPNSNIDSKEERIEGEEETSIHEPSEPNDKNNEPNDTINNDNEIAASSPMKRKDSEHADDNNTPKPKKSRKLQGAGVKKPLYSRYESLYIIKAFKCISDKHPNMVLIDLFKIVAILFNEEANRQGFKQRTPDQLYQKYKRIQHGLNHGEIEFLDFFKQNKYNHREWIPDFTKVLNDEILKYIRLPKLDEAINEIMGSSIANLKPPLPDLYDEEDYTEKTPASTGIGDDAEGPEEELLKLAGYEPKTSSPQFKKLQEEIIDLRNSLKLQQSKTESLNKIIGGKDQEIEFLKKMIKEDLSYIRHKLNETT